MNAVEIEEAVSDLASHTFDQEAFPFLFLEAYGNKATTIKRLREGNSNKSKIEGGVLQQKNIHIATCAVGKVADTLQLLHDAPETAKAKAQFILATDGKEFQAEDLNSGETIACAYPDFHEHFTFFFELAGISSVKEIRESTFDIKATSRLNKLYIELLRSNSEWATAERREDMNHFMARLIFCFFAEDTNIFNGDNLFTGTVQQMSASDASDTHEIIGELFRAMDTKLEEREAKGTRNWANKFPYVNGELFSGSTDCPKFTKIARSYLLHVGTLDWQQINPDIFGSMIQAVADEDERGSLGMHYTSVPNILKVLNPLFLDDLRSQLEEAGDNSRKLLNLRKRIARIRVFDPACGSGNFLVIAYKQLREIENEINLRRGESERSTEIPITNFRGIEIKGFSAEVARLALIIAEYQCDVLYLGQQLALAEFLPLDTENWITKGNALHINWLSVCPPTGTSVTLHGDDLFSTPLDQAEIDFDNEGGETYICGNPPYLGGKKQDKNQKLDMLLVFGKDFPYKNLDYICAFFEKASLYLSNQDCAAFVTTSSINQGSHVPTIWPRITGRGVRIYFAYKPFKWANNASSNAGVYVTILGIRKSKEHSSAIYDGDLMREVKNINSYLISAPEIIIQKESKPLSDLAKIITGNAAYDAKHLRLTRSEKNAIISSHPSSSSLFRRFAGTSELLKGVPGTCLWIDDDQLDQALQIPLIRKRIECVKSYRENGGEVARTLVNRSHQFRFRNVARKQQIVVPQVFSADFKFVPVGLFDFDVIISHLAHVMLDPSLYNFSIISSRLHFVWTLTLSGRHGNGLRYGSNLCWNTFPVSILTEKNKVDLTRCSEEILIARERHFPSTIADLYDPNKMPEDLKRAHERNDEVLERIYIGRRFKNDTERLEKLFELYTEMTAKGNAG